VRRGQFLVGHDDQFGLLPLFDLGDRTAFFVEQEIGHRGRHLDQHLASVLFHCLFFGDAQDRQRQRFDTADVAVAVALRTSHLRSLAERGTQPLARQFEQAEARNAAELDAGAVHFHGVAQAVFDLALVLARFHVDEVDHDQPTKVADAQLARHFGGGLEVGVERGFLDVAALGRLGRIDVDCGQRLGVVDHDRTARGQTHVAIERVFDLGLDLEAREQRHRILIQLELAQVLRHHLLHEFLGVVEQLLLVDQNLADIVAQVVAQGADDQLGFLVDQERRLARLGRLGDRFPDLDQVIEVPLQFFGVAAEPGGADDHAHFIGQLQIIHGVLEVLPVLAFDPARYAAGLGVVRHQHQVTAGQADEGGQRRALVAAFFLLDLDDQFLAFLDQFADAGLVRIDAAREIFAADLLERQEAVAVGAVFDEAGFQAGFDPGDAALVDIGLFLFTRGGFDIQVKQVLAIHDGHTQLFTLSRVDQHTFHCGFLALPRPSASAVIPASGAWGGLPRKAAKRVERCGGTGFGNACCIADW